MHVKPFAALFLASMVLAGEARAQEPPPDLKAALAPLGRFAGIWQKRFMIHKAEWSPEEQAKTGTHTAKWILNEHHLQEAGQDSDGSSYLAIYSYDATAREYRVSAYQSSGASWQMAGQWDARSSTFTWSRKLDGGVRMTATYQLVSPNEFRFSYVAKNNDGKVYFHLDGTGKRVKTEDREGESQRPLVPTRSVGTPARTPSAP